MVRPSYVLGGAIMQIVYDESRVVEYMVGGQSLSKHPVLTTSIFRSMEVDADAFQMGRTVVVAGIMEHIEEAGVHRGDSACSLPHIRWRQEVVEEIRRQMKRGLWSSA